jgi:general secretion pathway protein K
MTRAGHHSRRGVALLAALWLVVLITTVGTRLAVAASEHRAVGLSAADRARDQAVLRGALATLQARLEAQLRDDGRRAALPRRETDPWRDLPQGTAVELVVGEVPVEVAFLDLGTVRNLNLASELELTRLFAHTLRDAATAQRIAQAVLDWRDPDDLPRAAGGEREAYRAAGRVILPANAPFESVATLRHVLGVTPGLADAVRPFLATRGQVQRVNLNAAPEAVLRTLPGLTEPVLRRLLALRAAGRRVESIPGLLVAAGAANRSGSAGAEAQLLRSLQETTTLQTTDLLVTLRVRPNGPGPAAQLSAVLQRDADGLVRVSERQW